MEPSGKKIQADYAGRIDRVFGYIDKNLQSDLSLHTLAEVACFSPYHFHRVFKYITQETVNEYVTRRRIEKATLELIHRDAEISIVAMQVGFKDASSFTRTFKKYYRLSPREFRQANPNRFSKIRQLQSKNGQSYPSVEEYLCIINESKKWMSMNANIEVLEAPELNVAGVTHVGLNGVAVAFEKIIRWANGKGLMQDPDAKLGRIFYDSAKVTPPEKVRMTVFILPTRPFETEGDVNKLRILPSRCIISRFEINPDEFEKSWTGLFIWMNENGYKKGPGHPYEIYHNNYREHPENKFVVDFYIPIE